ncbi:MAG: polyamine aminopropyltransferase [Myxococcales bacterium]|nr:polyamine aminopropyltransferase [Myxococcales bacterium]
MALYYHEVFEQSVRFGIKIRKTIFEGESEYQRLEILDSDRFGRMLVLDGLFMTSEKDEFFYHEMLIQPALCTVPKLERVLVIGGGDGGSVREILRHPSVEKVVMVEIDEFVVNSCKKYLPMIGTAWDDPRLDLRFDDGIAYVKESEDEPFDVVIVDGTDPVGPGVVLFDLEFFRGCKRMLRPHGVLAMQSESPIYFEKTFVETQHKLAEIFETVRPYFGPVPIYSGGIWSWTFASDQVDPLELNEARVAAITPDSKVYNGEVHRAAFAQPNYIRKLIAG